MAKVKLSKEQADLLNDMGTIVNTADGGVYRFLPYWFKESKEDGVYESFLLGHLPDELVDAINHIRNITPIVD